MNKITAIVLAAGSGSRMKSKTKKQFMEIKGKPVIWYSLFEFEKSRVDEIILVTGKEDIDYCKKEIVEKYNLKKIKNVVAGGSERYESVYNGLKEVTGNIVLIHDGARPLINNEIIERINTIAQALILALFSLNDILIFIKPAYAIHIPIIILTIEANVFECVIISIPNNIATIP